MENQHSFEHKPEKPTSTPTAISPHSSAQVFQNHVATALWDCFAIGSRGKKTKNKKNPICFVLTDLKAGFKRILFSNKSTSVTHMAGKQPQMQKKNESHRRETDSKEDSNRLWRQRQRLSSRKEWERSGNRQARAWGHGGLVLTVCSQSNTTILLTHLCCLQMYEPSASPRQVCFTAGSLLSSYWITVWLRW